MLVVAGLSLKNLQPDVWNPDSPYYIPNLHAIMVSYGDFHQMPRQMEKAKDQGLREYLQVPNRVAIYLDNGAFYFLRSEEEATRENYQDFVENAKPDWYPAAFDVIPTPQMSAYKQRHCLEATMSANRAYQNDGYVPVIHVSRLLNEYVQKIKRSRTLSAKAKIALGGMVPNLLRAPKALSYDTVLNNLLQVRSAFADKELHVFGIGGTATLHLAALLEIDSADSSGWRNRAARGIVQLPGCGDRVVANLGSWRGREPSAEEWKKLKRCLCPACLEHGVNGLRASGLKGFCNRATHNLWVLLSEARWLQKHLEAQTYGRHYRRRLDNSTYLPLIEKLLDMQEQN